MTDSQNINTTENSNLVPNLKKRLIDAFLAENPKESLSIEQMRLDDAFSYVISKKKEQESIEESKKLDEESKKAIEKKREEYTTWVNNSVPKRYRSATKADFKDNQQIISLFDCNNSALIIGTNSVGKTHLSWALAKTAHWADKSVCVINAFRLFSEMKSKDSWIDQIKKYAGYDVLIVDEFDKSYSSATDYILLSELIDIRYNDMKVNIVIGNGTAESACKTLGQSVFARLTSDGGKLIQLSGANKRVNKNSVCS